MSVICAPDSMIRGLSYNTKNCSGEVVEETTLELPTCMMDASFQCNSRTSPAFIEKPGLTTL